MQIDLVNMNEWWLPWIEANWSREHFESLAQIVITAIMNG